MFNVSLSSFHNISEDIRDLTTNNIGQKVGTLGRHMGYWADIWYIGQISRKLGRYWGHWGHWVEIGDIRQTLGFWLGNIHVLRKRVFGIFDPLPSPLVINSKYLA